jgi:hypothetical protein
MITHWTKASPMALFACLFLFMARPVTVLADSFSGNMDAGKTVMVFSGTWSGPEGTTEMKVCTRRGTTSYALADLQGIWNFNTLASGTGAPWWLRGTTTVSNTTGSYRMDAVDNNNEPDVSDGFFYRSADGWSFTISVSATGLFRMDKDKTVMVGTSTWPPGTTVDFPILTRRAASYSPADMSGTWMDHTLASGTGAPQWSREIHIFNNGAFTFTKVKSNGHTGSGSGTMEITTDGGVMTIPGNHEPLQCVMDADKTVVVCTNTWDTGGASDDGTTSISVGLKRAASYSADDLVGTWDCNGLATGPGVHWWERSTITIQQNGVFSGPASDNEPWSGTINGTMVIASDGVVIPVIPGQNLLTVTASGYGAGTVNSGGYEVIFTYPAIDHGAAAIDGGATVILSASANSDSIASWSGDCTSTGGNSSIATCNISAMNGARNAAVLLTKKPARNAESAVYYTLLQQSYNEALNNQTVQMQATIFNENLNLANTNGVILSGGYSPDYSSNSGWTTITGTVTISGGPVTVDNLII